MFGVLVLLFQVWQKQRTFVLEKLHEIFGLGYKNAFKALRPRLWLRKKYRELEAKIMNARKQAHDEEAAAEAAAASEAAGTGAIAGIQAEMNPEGGNSTSKRVADHDGEETTEDLGEGGENMVDLSKDLNSYDEDYYEDDYSNDEE